MSELLAAARDTVGEMLSLGVDVSQAQLLLREAEEAFNEGKYERVREIHAGLHESLERAKGEMAAKRVEIELASLINDIQIAKSQNLDAREAESYLTKIEAAIQRKNYRQMEDYLRRAKESLARQRRHTVLSRARDELTKLQGTVAEAKEVQADLGDVEVLLGKAEAALQAEDRPSTPTWTRRSTPTARAAAICSAGDQPVPSEPTMSRWTWLSRTATASVPRTSRRARGSAPAWRCRALWCRKITRRGAATRLDPFPPRKERVGRAGSGRSAAW